MSYTPMMPGRIKDMPKGIPTGETCKLCGEPFFSGQLHSGVLVSTHPGLDADGQRITDEGYFEGHFTCVVQAIGAEETLKATHDGRLPLIDPSILVDGCLPDGWKDAGWVDIGAIQAKAMGRPPGVGALG